MNIKDITLPTNTTKRHGNNRPTPPAKRISNRNQSPTPREIYKKNKATLAKNIEKIKKQHGKDTQQLNIKLNSDALVYRNLAQASARNQNVSDTFCEYFNCAKLLAISGETAQAIAVLNEAIDALQQTQANPYWVAHVQKLRFKCAINQIKAPQSAEDQIEHENLRQIIGEGLNSDKVSPTLKTKARLELGLMLSKASNYPAAKVNFERALSLFKEMKKGYNIKVRVLLELSKLSSIQDKIKHLEDATIVIQDAGGHSVLFGSVFLHLAKAYKEEGNSDKELIIDTVDTAKRYFKKTKGHDLERAKYMNEVSKAYADMGKADKQIDALTLAALTAEEVEDEHTLKAEIYYKLGAHHFNNKNFPDAAEDLTYAAAAADLSDLSPEKKGHVHTLLGKSLIEINQNDIAIEAFQKAIEHMQGIPDLQEKVKDAQEWIDAINDK